MIQHVTFHLADSLPVEAIARVEEELKEIPSALRDAERRKKIDAWIDSGKGCCVLTLPEAARLVQEALLFFDGERYRLFAWAVMPNHVHVLFQPMVGWRVSRIVSSWKSFTGRRLSPLLPRSNNFPLIGPVWHREYWDRYIRDDLDFHTVREYIHQNPVKAGLVQRPEEWVWSSAGRSSGVRPPATLERGDPKRSAGLQPGMLLNQ